LDSRVALSASSASCWFLALACCMSSFICRAALRELSRVLCFARAFNATVETTRWEGSRDLWD
jgi:hypothetical protein